MTAAQKIERGDWNTPLELADLLIQDYDERRAKRDRIQRAADAGDTTAGSSLREIEEEEREAKVEPMG